MRMAELTFWPLRLTTRLSLPHERTLIQLTSDMGLPGWGEAPGVADPGLRETIRESVLEADVLDFEAIRTTRGRVPAPWIAALETAVLDIRGKAAGEPICRLLGGQVRDAVPLADLQPPSGPRGGAEPPGPAQGDPLLAALHAAIAAGPGQTTWVDFHELGGSGPARAVAEAVDRIGGRLALRGGVETGVGLTARLHLAASHRAIAGGLTTDHFALARDVLRFRLLRDDTGSIRVPAGSGLGVLPDPERIRDLTRPDG
jgi:L-alanine-DL-glutamate epimerase-like enolase superfamily enzyme